MAEYCWVTNMMCWHVAVAICGCLCRNSRTLMQIDFIVFTNKLWRNTNQWNTTQNSSRLIRYSHWPTLFVSLSASYDVVLWLSVHLCVCAEMIELLIRNCCNLMWVCVMVNPTGSYIRHWPLTLRAFFHWENCLCNFRIINLNIGSTSWTELFTFDLHLRPWDLILMAVVQFVLLSDMSLFGFILFLQFHVCTVVSWHWLVCLRGNSTDYSLSARLNVRSIE